MNTYGYITAFLLLVIWAIYEIPVPKKTFSELYDADPALEADLLRFRSLPKKSFKKSGVKWTYLSVGSGARHLLFMHGMGGAYDIWWQQIEALQPDYHIISLTLPEVHTLSEATAGILEILDREGVEKVCFVGTSMGGYMAQYFLRQHPDRLDALVLGNTFPPNDLFRKENGAIRKALPFIPEWLIMKIFRKNLAKTITPTSGNDPFTEAWLREQYFGLMTKKQFVGRLDLVLEYFDPGLPAAAENIPKLIIESDNDPLIRPDLRRQLKALYPDASVFTFHEKGHFPYLNDPQTYTRVLSGFLQEKVWLSK
ncbi:MAG: alpha/beta hydrolase [Bacteroidetes bacterium]|nr:MAG: alpha/beta hydrolase [Bacteroidota bacterium]